MDLTHLSVAQQRGLLDGGDISPVDLVGAALARMAVVQPSLNCFVEVWADEALDRAGSLGRPDGRPLHGIPVAIKNTTPWAGHRVTYGSRLHADHVARSTAVVVERLLDAGAVIVGSTNTPEFAHAGITDSPLHGPARNPWDTTRTTGGSSGGSAAAVSAGCMAIAEGSDMGGSVRIPAAWCGVVGLKPSLGRIPMDVLPGLWDTISHHGPLARSVGCARAFLAATAGPSLRDPLSHLPPWRTDRPDLSRLKVAWSGDLGCWEVDAATATAVSTTVDEMHEVVGAVSAAPPLFTPHDHELWVQLWGIFMAAYYGDEVEANPGLVDPDVVGLVGLGRRFSAVDAKRLEIERSHVWARVVSVLENHDVIVCPTMSRGPGPAAKADADAMKGSSRTTEGRLHSEDMTTVWNLVSPLPVISVPCGRHGGQVQGLPVGLQIVGRPGREDVVLALAEWVESRSGSATWRPPL